MRIARARGHVLRASKRRTLGSMGQSRGKRYRTHSNVGAVAEKRADRRCNCKSDARQCVARRRAARDGLFARHARQCGIVSSDIGGQVGSRPEPRQTSAGKNHRG